MQDAGRTANILFVDDEQRVLTSMRAMFRRDYTVFLANSGAEALEVLEKEHVDVIVSDQRMPGMTGVEVLKAFKDNAPGAMRILLTGYADQEAIAASINDGEVFRYLTKPCPPELLKETIGLAVDAAAASRPASATTPAERVGEIPEDLLGSAEALLDEVLEEPILTEEVAPAPKVVDGKDVELLLLSNDPQLTKSLQRALNRSHVLHAVERIDDAVQVLERQPVGVLITDIAINADEVQALTNQLKLHVPELVTIVASDHSDAHRLIELINGGQVFRFLLKPIKAKQTSIWIESAIGKHVELLRNPDLLARHVVVEDEGSKLRKLGDQLAGIASRVMRFRGRSSIGPGRV